VRLDTANSGPYANDSFDAVPLDPGALLRDFAPAATIVLAFLLVFGLLGGWVLVGRMLAPFDWHHRRHAHGRERIAFPPDPATGPQR
jgi:hypothetical protein